MNRAAPPPAFPDGALRRWQGIALVAGVIGLVVAVAFGISGGSAFFQGYLTGFVLWIGIPLGCGAILMIHHLTGGGWGWSVRRMCEAAVSTLPLFAALFVPLLFGLRRLYGWMTQPSFPHPGLMPPQETWFNLPFFLVRSAFFFALWIIGFAVLRRWSMREERTADPAMRRPLKRLSAGGLVIYCFSVSFAFIDWVGSLEVRWYSSIYGMYILIDQGLAALALLVLVLIASGRDRSITPPPVSRQRLNDLGNLLLAFVMLHAYIAFSQWLIIWNGNLPHEITWYERRIHGGWGAVIVAIILLQFALPFAALVFQRAKRAVPSMTVIAGVIFAAAVIHTPWLVLPAFREGTRPVVIAAAAMVGIGGIWFALFLRQWRLQGEPFTDAPPVPAVTPTAGAPAFVPPEEARP